MKMLTCYLAPTARRARRGGLTTYSTNRSRCVRKRIRVPPEDTPIYRDT